MRYCLLLTVASLLPAAVAAPIPRDAGRAEFGTGGLLTRADLEKVKFDSRPVKGKGDPESNVGPPKFDVAVHLPWAKFREGEPMPAYFVLRNNTAETLGVDGQLSLYGPRPAMWNGCRFSITPLTPGVEIQSLLSVGWRCGSGSLVDVPPNGFYCVKGDLNQLLGSPLPPGDYEVEWRYRGLQAAPVKFTVAKADAKPARAAKRSHVHFYSLAPGPESDPWPKKPGNAVTWRECSLASQYTDSMAAALSVGQNGVYIPDIHEIPAADKLVEASVEWKRYREGDRVAVTLRAVPPNKYVRFDELPQLFLQIDSREDRLGRGFAEESARGDAKHTEELLVTPLTIEVQLPRGWRDRLTAGEARVAVMVASRRIEFPLGNRVQRIKESQRLVRVEDRGDERRAAPVWNGIVRTEFTELRFPPAPPKPE